MSWNTCQYEEVVSLYNSGLSRREIGRRFQTSHSQITAIIGKNEHLITRQHSTPTIRQRFEKFVMPEPMSGCWLWDGAVNDKGYGQIGMGRGSAKYAHRVSYELHKGKIPKGLHICHHCDNPICVNPNYLFAGTRKDNMQDMIMKGRAHHQKIRG